jgi:aminoglycoside phosphotransferase (APT) family kinase protein
VPGEKADWVVTRPDVPMSCAEADELLEPWRGSLAVTAVSQLEGGLMNRIYRVQLGDDTVALRFYDRDPRACAKETSILRDAHGIVAVPEVLFVNDAVPFAVLEFIDGIALTSLKKFGSAAAIGEVAYDAGVQLAKLSSVKPSHEELLTVDLSIDPEVLHGSNVNARVIDHCLKSPILQRRLTPAQIAQVHDFAWRRDDRLAALPATAIVHGDFNSPNILVRQEAGRYRVAAILDWEFAFIGSIFYDIGNFLRYERANVSRYEPWFSRGLADGGIALPSDCRAIARLADLGALCELLTRVDIPENVVTEVRDLVLENLSS